MKKTNFRVLLLHRKNIMRAVGVFILAVLVVIGTKPTVEAVFNQSQENRKLPIYCVKTDQPQVSISFDVAWGADDTEELLSILKANDVKSTFFISGYWVDKYPDEVKRIYEEGHDIGNHTNTHVHGNELTLEKNKEEIQGVHDKVKQLLGVEMNLYRPPFGEYNDTVLQAAEELGYYAVQWDVDSLDWKNLGVQQEVSQVLNHKHLDSGSIILFHGDVKYTPKALDTIIKGLKEKGYEIVPVSQLIHQQNYYIDHEGRQIPNVK